MECCDLTGSRPSWTAEQPPTNGTNTQVYFSSLNEASTCTPHDGLLHQPQQHTSPQPLSQLPSCYISHRGLEQQSSVDHNINSDLLLPSFATLTATSTSADITLQAARYSNSQGTWASAIQHNSLDNMRRDNSRGFSRPYSRGSSVPHATADYGSQGSMRSNSSSSGSQASHRGSSRHHHHHHSNSYGNLRSGSPYYNNSGYQSYRNPSPRGNGGRYGGYSGSGSVSGFSRPGSAGAQLCWIRQGCFLVPRLGNRTGPTAANSPAPLGQRPSADSQVGSSSSIGRDKVVVIMRGLPGAGKSTRAAQIAAEARAVAAATAGSTLAAVGNDSTATSDCNDHTPGNTLNTTDKSAAHPVVAIHSTDSYFIDAVTGVYTFDFEELSNNHQKNYEAYCASLDAGVRTIIVDNTNIQPWQFERYVTAAWSAGYQVKEEVVGEFTEAAAAKYAERNVHGVPHDKIIMMLDQWRRQ